MIIIRAKGVGATRPIARVGDDHNCHKICKEGVHKGGKIFTGSSFTKVNGVPAAKVGDKAHCLVFHDKIKKGANPITLAGMPIAIQGSKCEHGGMVTSGSPNVFVGEALPLSISNPIAPGPQQPSQTPGKHWIQGQYLDSNGEPITNLPYAIIHEDGTTKKGMLDGSGKTANVTGLHQGTATIHFGDRPKLEQQLDQQRTQLKQYLDQILAKTKAAAQQQREKYAHSSYSEKLFATNVAFVKGLGDGLLHLAEGTAKGVVNLFKDIAESEQIQDEGMQASLSGNTKELQQLQQQSIKQGQAMFGPIEKGVKLMEAIYQDPKTKQLLENFAINYYNSETPIMQSHQAGELVGGIVPGIVVAAITKNPDVVAPEIAGEVSGDLAGVATEANKIEKTLEDLKKCKTIDEADVDKEHKVNLESIKHQQLLDKYMQKADTVNVNSETNSAIFYSGPGNRKLAEDFAAKTGKTTLEMTQGGSYLDNENLFDQLPRHLATQPWQRLSQRYAEAAKGKVYAFVTGARKEGIFNSVELPTLESNSKITDIIYEANAEK